MIVRLRGQLAEIAEDRVVIERDGLAYEVLVPGYAVAELAAQRSAQVTLHTLQHIEGNAAGGNLLPRMIGFLRPEDRAFFKQFITVKGLGVRKGLRALAESVPRVAAAVESGDAAALARLPGIGKRMAETIVAELRGKLAAYARSEGAAQPPLDQRLTADQRDAIEILVAWGDTRSDAQRWIARAAQVHSGMAGPDEWVRAAYRIKSGGEA